MIVYNASIRVFSKTLTAEEIEKVLNIKCTEKKKKGEPRIKHEKGTLKIEDNVWILKSDTDKSLPLSHHVENLLKKIRPNIDKFSLLKNCEIMCQCIIERDEEDGTPEINFPYYLINNLASINAGIDVDIYIF